MLGHWEDPLSPAESIEPTAGCTPATWRGMREDGRFDIDGRLKVIIRGHRFTGATLRGSGPPEMGYVPMIGVPVQKDGEELCS